MTMHWMDDYQLLAIGFALMTGLFLLLRWLYLRSMRIRNQLLMSQLLTNITHELLTPLTIISASVEKMRDTPDAPQRDLDLMDLNIRRSVHLLQQILETSKLQAGELRLLVSNVDVMRHITDTARSIVPLMERNEIDFSLRCQPESMMGWVDTDKLDKVIFNLLSNAAKYAGAHSRVSLSATTNANYDHITIHVTDNGPGIPFERQRNLFTRFYDGDYRRARTMGTGLGLALTRDLVLLHKGRIRCHSIEGEGTDFEVELPIRKDNFSPQQIDERAGSTFQIPSYAIIDLPMRPLTPADDATLQPTTDADASHILLVEDNQELLMLMRQLLQHRYHVLTAADGQQAWEAIQQHQELDLIVSDVMMPRMDGLQLTGLIKQDEVLRHLPVILITAKLREEDREEALTVGADDVICKPFKLRDLQLRIDNIIANRQRVLSDRTATSPDETNDETADGRSSMAREYLQRAEACVMEHLMDSDYDREHFAADMGSSVSTLYNRLRELTGKSPSSYVRDLRIRQACRLADENPDLRVSDIAYRVGFKDPKYFATTFKRVMGVQPKEYFRRGQSERRTENR